RSKKPGCPTIAASRRARAVNHLTPLSATSFSRCPADNPLRAIVIERHHAKIGRDHAEHRLHDIDRLPIPVVEAWRN
ncbi:hypothetical protein, partial [Novosphingobium sp. Rr 2-17]|uniref:hypothetical protein n=1 Tax=Novosphingobium sp. Rr 2-17 TaxID=555793 RepID=UPI001ED8CCFE